MTYNITNHAVSVETACPAGIINIDAYSYSEASSKMKICINQLPQDDPARINNQIIKNGYMRSQNMTDIENRRINTMEEQKNSEMTDEALDTVSGGAYYKLNEDTGFYDVYLADGTKYGSVTSKDTAFHIATSLTMKEIQERTGAQIPPFR